MRQHESCQRQQGVVRAAGWIEPRACVRDTKRIRSRSATAINLLCAVACAIHSEFEGT